MNITQNLVFPNLDIQAPDDLYVRYWGGTQAFRNEREIRFLQKGAGCVFDTFFNSFTIQTWKNQTNIHQIKLRLFGHGEFLIKIRRHKLHEDMKHLNELTIQLNESGTDIDFADLNDHTEGMLFFELISLTDNAYVNRGFYHTDLEPQNPVKLGIVITHLNRKHCVLPAIDRVSNDLLQDPYYKDKISLIVVDNSRNITQEEAKHAIVIPNQNLGGSGGFTRGLMYLEDEKSYTHCLFMDDDASCEIESIRRAYALLQYATTEKFAVAGAQLQESEPYKIHEKGAVFSRLSYQSICHGLDTRNAHDVLLAEISDVKPNYGGWWLFAFKIKDIKFYSFPFFVRGDDVSFGFMNEFNITTLNGINVWAEDFFIKEGLWTRYLGFRGSCVSTILQDSDYSKSKIRKVFKQWYFNCIHSYNYSSAKAIILALEDFLAGTQAFTSDMTASNARAKLAQLPQDEKMQPINRIDYPKLRYPTPVKKRKHELRRIIRQLTLNYLLLPERFMKKGIIFQPKHFGANLTDIYRYGQVYYEHEATRTGYVATFDRQRLIQAYKDYFAALRLIDEKFDTAKADYLSKKDELTSRAFWEKIYNTEK
uniref:PamC n=1 Tax=Kingella kingae TaxID=504 RepID=G1AUD7_KINKI|nr:PamC [Kingella kingae]